MKNVLIVLVAIAFPVLATDYQSILSNDLTVSDAAPASDTKGLVVRTVGTVTTSSGTGASSTEVQGPAADGAAAVGDPIQIGGMDGSGNIQTILVDTSGRLNITNAAAGTIGAAVPGFAGMSGFKDDSGNAQHSRAYDGDSGAGTEYVLGAIMRQSSSGGTVEVGTAANPLRTDPVGTTTQPVNVKAMPAAATVDTGFTAQTADFTAEAATANLRMMGWSIKEDAGTAAVATVTLRHDADGTCDGTTVIAFIELDANQSAQMNYGDRGLAVPSGVCADVTAGSVSFAAQFVTEAAP